MNDFPTKEDIKLASLPVGTADLANPKPGFGILVGAFCQDPGLGGLTLVSTLVLKIVKWGGRVSKLVATILPYSNLAIIVCFYDLVRHSKKALTFSIDP